MEVIIDKSLILASEILIEESELKFIFKNN